jgi:ferredoxin
MTKLYSWSVWVAGVVRAAGLFAAAGVAYAAVPTFSQYGATVGLGQSATIASQNGVSLYVEMNSGPTIATVAANGTQITVIGQALGTTNLTVCAVGTASDCANLSVTVQSGSVSGISFSPSSLTLSTGGNQTVTVSGGNGTYTISNNSNTSVASTNLSGSALTITGVAAGGATISVCDTAGACGTFTVTVNASSSSNTGGISFSQNNLSFATGGGQAVTISGGNGTYHVSGSSNANVASTNVSSNVLTVSAIAAGSVTVTVCDTANVCGGLSVTVTAPTTSQAITFTPASPTLAVGQSVNVALSGGTVGYVVLSNSNASIVQASVNGGSTLSLSGLAAGSDTITVCATAGGCSSISVTVTGSAAAATSVTQPATTTTQAAPVVQSAGTVVANTALLAEISTLQTAVTQVLSQIQSIQTQLNQLQVQVNAGSGGSVGTSSGAAVNTSSGGSYNFTELLTVGSQDAQVAALQQRLATLGFYSGSVTGFYGTLTEQAVMKYQTAHGIAPLGYVGPSTRTALNAGN